MSTSERKLCFQRELNPGHQAANLQAHYFSQACAAAPSKCKEVESCILVLQKCMHHPVGCGGGGEGVVSAAQAVLPAAECILQMS